MRVRSLIFCAPTRLGSVELIFVQILQIRTGCHFLPFSLQSCRRWKRTRSRFGSEARVKGRWNQKEHQTTEVLHTLDPPEFMFKRWKKRVAWKVSVNSSQVDSLTEEWFKRFLKSKHAGCSEQRRTAGHYPVCCWRFISDLVNWCPTENPDHIHFVADWRRRRDFKRIKKIPRDELYILRWFPVEKISDISKWDSLVWWQLAIMFSFCIVRGQFNLGCHCQIQAQRPQESCLITMIWKQVMLSFRGGLWGGGGHACLRKKGWERHRDFFSKA